MPINEALPGRHTISTGNHPRLLSLSLQTYRSVVMHWRTLKIVTVVALLASPSAFAARSATVDPDGATGVRNTAPLILLAEHSHGPRDGVRGDRPRRFDGQRGRDVRPFVPPRFRGYRPPWFRGQRPSHFRGYRPRHFRGYPPRHFRGWPPRRHFRPWRRQY